MQEVHQVNTQGIQRWNKKCLHLLLTSDTIENDHGSEQAEIYE